MAAPIPRFHIQLAGVITLGAWWDYPINDAMWRWWVARDAGSGVRLEDGTVHQMQPMAPIMIPPWRKGRTVITGEVLQAHIGFLVMGLPIAWVRSAIPTVVELPAITDWREQASFVANPARATMATRLRMEALMANALAHVLQHHDPEEGEAGDANALQAVSPALRACLLYTSPSPRDH
jgi:hypothetical protein